MASELTMWDLIQYKLRKQQLGTLPGKRRFGKLMHDITLEDEKKQEIAERVLEAGGYDALEDDDDSTD